MFKFIPVLMGLLMVCAGVGAQEIRVTKTYAAKVTVDISGIRPKVSGDLFMKTLKEDLDSSGWVSVGLTGFSAFGVSGSYDLVTGTSQKATIGVVNNSTRQPVLNQVFSQTNNDQRRLAHVVADAIIYAITGKRGFLSCRLILIGSSGKGKELYACDADGRNLVQVTHDSSIVMAPAWSDRGDQVIYTSFKGGFPDVYIMNPATGHASCVAKYPGMNMAGDISPNGQDAAIILSKDGNPELYIKNLLTGKLTRMTTTRNAGEASPSWSPDGSQIVYVADIAGAASPQLYIIGRGTVARRLTTRGSENVAPDWGRNNLIAYSSKRSGHYALVVYDPSSGEHRVISQDQADYEDPTWAPDGRHIFCGRSAGYRSEIYMLDTMGDAPIRLELNSGNWRSPACSP